MVQRFINFGLTNRDGLKLIIAVFISFLVHSATAQNKWQECAAYRKGDSVIIENDLIRRVFLFNKGNLSSFSLTNKTSGKQWLMEGRLPDFLIPGMKVDPTDVEFRTRQAAGNQKIAPHLEAEVVARFGDLQVKRVFKIYPSTPAIACDTYLKGKAVEWQQMARQSVDLTNIETAAASNEGQANAVVIDRLSPARRHWKVKSVEFFDATDQNNTLIQEYARVPYRQEVRLRGNVLLMHELPSEEGLFWLKEAPVSAVQLGYPGYDFSIKFNDFKTAGIGIEAKDLSETEWTRGYSIVIGVASGGEEGTQRALRTYQQNIRPVNPAIDNMILLNTWGDRGQDKNINEAFILNEIQLGAKLGITHLQLDDGWQTGRSANSAFKGGSFKDIWRNENYWNPDPAKFPNGFDSIISAAKKNEIVISTWFNPSVDSSFKYWQNDAGVLISQYKKYGIHMWKIDGVKIADKLAEVNFRKMLDTVVKSTNNEAIFNLDVTAGRRFGYNYFYEYGNLFLENRYTDWANYYPHFTLINLWMLSKYIPSQRLQIEFLNKWRNTDKYPKDDPFSPANYSFDYLFAITMAAQPLAWMEARNLPPEAFNIATLIKEYKKYWQEWHSGQIFPIGEEPSGTSWTGFQSILKSKSAGYVLVYREMTTVDKRKYNLRQIPSGKYLFKLLAGNGKSFNATLASDRSVIFQLPKERSFAFYRYELNK